MRKFMLCLGAAAVFATAAVADDSVLASRFGNTTITKAGGEEIHIYYNADHTFGIKIGDKKSTGSWKIDGGTLCLTYTDLVPKGASNPTCLPVSAHKVGDSWGAGPYSVSLVAGIQ